MKRIVISFFIFLMALSSSVWAESSHDFSYDSFRGEIGTSLKRPCGECVDPDSTFYDFTYRHYTEKKKSKLYKDTGVYIQGRVVTFNGGNLGSDHGGTWVGVGFGYRTNGMKHKFMRKFFLEAGADYGYLDNPDGRNEDGKGLLTQNGQWGLNIGGGYRISKRINLVSGYHHFSNGHSLFNRGEASAPNIGRDWWGFGAEIRFGRQ